MRLCRVKVPTSLQEENARSVLAKLAYRFINYSGIHTPFPPCTYASSFPLYTSRESGTEFVLDFQREAVDAAVAAARDDESRSPSFSPLFLRA